VLAATGGILLLSEPITFRYLVTSIAVLGGIALVVIEKNDAGKANDTISSAAR
jgi:drug/metabolite transporter (DMT)-like permease